MDIKEPQRINAKSIKKNYAYNVLYEIFALIAPLITTPYISRILTATGVGVYSYTNSLAQYFVILGNLGVAMYGQMAISAVRDDRREVSKVFWELFILRFCTTFISLALYSSTILMLGSYRIPRLILCVTVFASAFDISWLFRGIEDFSRVVIRNLLVKIAVIILIFVCVKGPEDVNKYIALIAFSTLIGNITFFIPARKIITKVSFHELRYCNHLKQCLIFFLPTIATSVYTILDKSMIGWLTGGTMQNGYYEQAHKIEQILITLIISLNTIMRSRMTYLFKRELYEELRTRLNNSLSFILFLAIPMCAGLVGIAPNFVPFFLGEGYDESIVLLQIFSLLFIFIGLSNCLNTHILGPSGRQKKVNIVLVIGAAINALMNMLTIPVHGAVGAACSSVIAEMIILIGYLWLSRDFITAISIFHLSWKYLIAGIVMMLAVIKVGAIECSSILLIVIQVATGITVYLFLVVLLKDRFLKQNIGNLWNIIVRKAHISE